MISSKIIGFCGYPDPDVIKELKNKYPEHTWLDLDIDFKVPESKIIPNAYCKIMKNIINNAFYYKDYLELIVIAVGREKCDSAWFASKVLKDYGFNIIETTFQDNYKIMYPQRISTSSLPLRQKFELITKQIISRNENLQIEQSKPAFGFWGVPPNDLSILELFPDDTHVFGWTRCVEAGQPGNIELEMYVEKDIPIVFYAQAFCAKAQLAKHLSLIYNGLYIDIDDIITNSIRSKVEAFLKLR